MLKILPVIFILCFQFGLSAQVNLDSLNALLPESEGMERVDLLNAIAWEIKFSEPDKAWAYCEESIEIAKANKHVQGEAQAYYQMAAFKYLKGEIPRSLELCATSIALFESLNNSLGLAKNLMLEGLNHLRLKNYAEAIEKYDKTLAICELFEYEDLRVKALANKASLLYDKGDYHRAIEEFSTIAAVWLEQGDSSNYYLMLQNIAITQRKVGQYNESLSNLFKLEAYQKANNNLLFLANVYNDIGIIYLRLGLGEPTFEMFQKAIDLYEELGNYRKLVLVNMNLGIYYSDNENYEDAEFYYEKAQHLNDSLGLTHKGMLSNNIGELKVKTARYEEAIELLEESLEINTAADNKAIIAKNHVNMAAAYYELGEIEKSEQNYLKALQLNQEIGDLIEEQKVAEGLATIYKQNNNDQAFERYSTIAKTANDSLFNRKKLLELNKLMVTKQYEEYKQKTEALNQKLAETEAQLANAERYSSYFFSRYKIPLLALLALLVVGVFWLFVKLRRSADINKTLKNEAVEYQKEHETIIENKNKQLTLLSLETLQQSDHFKKIHDSLQKIIAENPENADFKQLNTLLKTQAVEQNSWENFITYFNQVYVGFLDRIAQKHPSITSKELRHCALIRLKIPVYETSIILGVSPRSVHKSRYRIRKKMDLDSEANLDEFIYAI